MNQTVLKLFNLMNKQNSFKVKIDCLASIISSQFYGLEISFYFANDPVFPDLKFFQMNFYRDSKDLIIMSLPNNLNVFLPIFPLYKLPDNQPFFLSTANFS